LNTYLQLQISKFFYFLITYYISPHMK